MNHESKTVESFDKIIDAIFYEQGRLVIIDKYGSTLGEDDKAIVIELISKQRDNLDRFLSVYKEQLVPIINDIHSVSQEISPFVDKVLVTQGNSQQVVEQQTGDFIIGNNDASVSESNGNQPIVDDNSNNEIVVSEPTATDEQSNVENAGSFNLSPIGETQESAYSAVSNAESTPLAIDGVGTPTEEVSVAIDSALTSGVDAGTSNVENNVSDLVGFVLSPIDEGVSPVNTPAENAVGEETNVVEEGAASVEQQLQAIDAVKQDIISSPDMTPDEKEAELKKYTRVSDAAVRAILVTKVQYEKLLASKTNQKELVSPVKEDGAVIPAIVGEEATGSEVKTDANAEATATPDTPVVSETSQSPVVEVKSDSVLPMVESIPVVTPTVNDTTSQPATPEVDAIPVVAADATIPGLATSEGVGKQKELQAMIEQANSLYKEGKTQEAQEIFDKVGAINREMQAVPTTDSVDPAVLVKK